MFEGLCAEIEQEANSMPAGFEIVEYLGFFETREPGEGLELHDNRVITHEISSIRRGQSLALVRDWNFYLSPKWNTTLGQFSGESFLIYSLQESCPQLSMDLQSCSDDGEGSGVSLHDLPSA